MISQKTKDKIIELYNQGNSANRIAKIVGVSHPTVSKNLKKLGITLKKPVKLEIPKQELIKLFLNDKLTISKIAAHFGASDETIRKRLKEHGINTSQNLKEHLIITSRGLHHKDWYDKDFLYNEYVLKQKSLRQLVDELNSTDTTIVKKLNEFNIPIRSLSEANSIAANKEHNKITRSITSKKLWQDETYAQKVKDGIKQTDWKPTFTDEYREKLSIAAKLRWVDPEYRDTVTQYHKDNHDIDHLTSISHTFWSDNEKVEKWREKIQSEEHRMLQSLNAIKQWKDPEFLKKLPQIKEKLSKFVKKLWQDPEYREKNLSNRTKTSSLERVVHSILTELKIPYKKIYLGGFEFDILIDSQYRMSNKNLLIEINGEYVHRRIDRTIQRDIDRQQYYIDNLVNNYDFEYIWEHEFGARRLLFNQLINIIKPNFEYKIDNYSFNDLDIKKIVKDPAIELFDKYHYLEGRRWIGHYTGAYLNDSLVAAALFTGTTRLESARRLGLHHKKVRELSRFCINPIYNKPNLGSWFMKKAMSQLEKDSPKVEMLLTFADTTIGHTGALYKSSNWKYDGLTDTSYFYTKNGYTWGKRNIWKYAKSCSLTESEFVEIIGLTKIKTGKKHRFIYDLR